MINVNQIKSLNTRSIIDKPIGSVRSIISDFYFIVRFGLPNSLAKSELNSLVISIRPNFKIGKVRFASAQKFSVRFTTDLST